MNTCSETPQAALMKMSTSRDDKQKYMLTSCHTVLKCTFTKGFGRPTYMFSQNGTLLFQRKSM